MFFSASLISYINTARECLSHTCKPVQQLVATQSGYPHVNSPSQPPSVTHPHGFPLNLRRFQLVFESEGHRAKGQ